jgi:hypothetical protein
MRKIAALGIVHKARTGRAGAPHYGIIVSRTTAGIDREMRGQYL